MCQFLRQKVLNVQKPFSRERAGFRVMTYGCRNTGKHIKSQETATHSHMRHKKYALFHAEIIRNGIPGLREQKSLRFLKISGPFELF